VIGHRETGYPRARTTEMKTLSKPKVKYGKSPTNPDIKYKYTLLTTITRPEAKAIRKSRDADHGLYWLYVDNRKIEIYDEQMYTVRKK
jgi:hypothetical protein